MEIRSHDMYGNEIHLLGETGYGVSFTVARSGSDITGIRWPYFAFFHVSDGFRQCLFCVDLPEHKAFMPSIINVFHERIDELMSTRPHG